jgi:hypothetical protein
MSEDHTYDADALDEDSVGRVGKVEAGSPAPTSGAPPPAPPPPPSAKVAADFAENAAMVKDILSVDSGGESGPTATGVRGEAAAAPPAISEVTDPPGPTSDVPISPDLFPSRPTSSKKRSRRPK